MVALRFPVMKLELRKNGMQEPHTILTYDLVKKRIVAKEPECIWSTFSKEEADWISGGSIYSEGQTLLSVFVTKRNIRDLEMWLWRRREWRSAWKLRALFPEYFLADPGAFRVRVRRQLARFV